MTRSIVIVGAGQAGFQVAASLRQDGFNGGITLIGQEAGHPYQRPPLSKAYLLGKITADALLFREPAYFEQHHIALREGIVSAIDRGRKEVVLATGEVIGYDHLVLATGAENRTLQVLGSQLDGVLGLRTLEDAKRLAAELTKARQVVVIGAGFIGLEFAAVASTLGCRIRVIDVADRPMARALSRTASVFFEDAHAESGIQFEFGQTVARIEAQGNRACGVTTSGGFTFPADLVAYGIGVLPNVALALQSDLLVENGICVDADLLTSDPSISAIGDCASFPNRHASGRVRIESVQNALDQARCVAARLAGKPHAYEALPWFWSDQGALRLQIAGLRQDPDETVVVGTSAAREFSVLCFSQGKLQAVESINRPGDHMAARRILARPNQLTESQASAAGFDLRAFEVASR
jgi:3-phenylpropionate/trans-cinnamate dioxygenase ferredoxin reductase subunit